MIRINLVLFFLISIVSCKQYSIDQNNITIKIPHSKEVKTIQIEVISQNLFHIKATPLKHFEQRNSLITDTLINNGGFKNWKVSEKNDTLEISTEMVSLKVSLVNGHMSFWNNTGKLILKENEDVAKIFNPVELDGNNFYSVTQIFDSPENEAFYGLGQHQHGLVNLKGKDVELMQHNIVAVVPFLISSKNYGILWDNYSITKFGDPRDYKRLNTLELYNENGENGGLTARYYNDWARQNLLTTQTDQDVYYKYLPDIKHIPEDFSLTDGMVEWTGYIESDTTGIHKFIPYSAGYFKLWLNNTLVIDCWRQCWNPWSRQVRLDMKKGEKVPIRIEWYPNGAESFVSLEWLPPYRFEMQNKLQLSSQVAHEIDYYFVAGKNLDEVISGYRTITGKAPIMPKWAAGLWQSRERYKTQLELLEVVKEYRKRNIPLDNIVLDWHYWKEDKWGDHSFERNRFPDTKGMIDELHDELNANIMISVWPKYYENTINYKIMKDNGWLYMQNINNRQKDWVGPGYVSTFYDAFNPAARKEFWKQISDSLFSLGIDGWWLDATEPDILSNTSPAERKKLMGANYLGTSDEFFNAYSLQQSKGVYEGQREEAPNKRVFILTRSAFAGQQRYASATWSGDVVSRWSDLKEQIAAGMSMGASGIPYWTTDIGGFALEDRYINPNENDLNEWRELNLRWFQFGAFSPLFRIHGQYPYREIYNISPENNPVYKSMVYYNKLRYRLLPYIYTLYGMTFHDNYTIMRPLIMDFSDDLNVRDIKDAYMFGPSLMVCPIYEYGKRNREIYMPANGGWYDILSGQYYKGGNLYDINVPLNKIPVFAPEGTILPLGPEIQYVNEKLPDPITLLVFSGHDGEFTLYEDEGVNYNYEQGTYTKIPFEYNHNKKTLTIEKQQGFYPGMIKERTFIIKYITPNNTRNLLQDDSSDLRVKYTGEKIEIKLIPD